MCVCVCVKEVDLEREKVTEKKDVNVMAILVRKGIRRDDFIPSITLFAFQFAKMTVTKIRFCFFSQPAICEIVGQIGLARLGSCHWLGRRNNSEF